MGNKPTVDCMWVNFKAFWELKFRFYKLTYKLTSKAAGFGTNTVIMKDTAKMIDKALNNFATASNQPKSTFKTPTQSNTVLTKQAKELTEALCTMAMDNAQLLKPFEMTVKPG